MPEAPVANRVYNGLVHRVVSQNVLDVYIGLGMGVMVLKRVVIEGAPGQPKPLRPSADTDAHTYPSNLNSDVMQCLIVLVGGKKVRVETAQETCDFQITARVGVRSRNPPPASKWQVEATSLLDVGKYMAELAASNDYDVSAVRAVLNGPQKH